MCSLPVTTVKQNVDIIQAAVVDTSSVFLNIIADMKAHRDEDIDFISARCKEELLDLLQQWSMLPIKFFWIKDDKKEHRHEYEQSWAFRNSLAARVAQLSGVHPETTTHLISKICPTTNLASTYFSKTRRAQQSANWSSDKAFRPAELHKAHFDNFMAPSSHQQLRYDLWVLLEEHERSSSGKVQIIAPVEQTSADEIAAAIVNQAAAIDGSPVVQIRIYSKDGDFKQLLQPNSHVRLFNFSTGKQQRLGSNCTSCSAFRASQVVYGKREVPGCLGLKEYTVDQQDRAVVEAIKKTKAWNSEAQLHQVMRSSGSEKLRVAFWLGWLLVGIVHEGKESHQLPEKMRRVKERAAEVVLAMQVPLSKPLLGVEVCA